MNRKHPKHHRISESEMGNCQAIDTASLVIQHPNGKAEKFYAPVPVIQIMKLNPGHHVALQLTTTVYSAAAGKVSTSLNCSDTPLRITRIKLMRPTDILVLGHVYRLVTSQEVMKGLSAKKQAKIKQIITADFELVVRDKTKQVNHERQSSRIKHTSFNTGGSKSRAWQWHPSLGSISEAAS